MSANSFDKTSFGWQFQQLQQRVGEWLEVRLSPALTQAANSIGVPPDWVWDLLLKIAWLIFGLVMAWVMWQIYKLLRPYILSLIVSNRTGSLDSLMAEDGDRQAYSVADWLREVQQLQSEGKYGDACRALYMALLLRLSDAELIASQASRTDREYLKLLQKIPQSQPCQLLIATHEQLWFGNTTVSSETFDRCQQAYEDVDRRLRSLYPKGTG
jgi:hypothetical protein